MSGQCTNADVCCANMAKHSNCQGLLRSLKTVEERCHILESFKHCQLYVLLVTQGFHIYYIQ